MLIYLGLEQYNQNKLAGATTVEKRAKRLAKQQAEAEAQRAAIERRKAANYRKPADSTPAPTITPILHGDE